ncbi:site-specific integrase [Terasakiella sp. SH-1]|uniref:site-specific integrase n=1 Tax=Terasakiella sp. SH-1 TaxID=2560057 RepID=UPI001430C85A|nr:site-specific integrase [Terasakiella sp. SH-1]
MDDPARQRSRKTVMTYESVFKVLVEVLGEDKDIGEINRDDCRYVLDVIRYLPANAKKKFPKKTLVQISEIARKRKMSPMAPLTINKYISKLAAMLSWAVEEELLDHNPAKNLSVADPIHQQGKRLPFSDWQLKKIFTALEGKSGAEYWVPYIGFYNGMRLNEICQLNVEDVQQHDGIWCFAITRDRTIGVDDKILKTKASERTIPIHPRLIEMGFMKYLKRFERKPRSKLFPDIPAGTTGYRSDTFSKNFRRFLRSIEADADRTSFHSFRHNFRDALREGNVRHEIAMLLGGWSDRSRSQATQMFYGRGFSIETIYEELAKVVYTELDN